VSQSDVSAFEDNPNIINSNKNTQTNSNPSFKPTLNQYTSSRHFTTVEAWTINNFTSDNTTTECKKRNTEVVIVEKPGNFTNTQDFHLSGNIILINNNNNNINSHHNTGSMTNANLANLSMSYHPVEIYHDSISDNSIMQMSLVNSGQQEIVVFSQDNYVIDRGVFGKLALYNIKTGETNDENGVQLKQLMRELQRAIVKLNQEELEKDKHIKRLEEKQKREIEKEKKKKKDENDKIKQDEMSEIQDKINRYETQKKIDDQEKAELNKKLLEANQKITMMEKKHLQREEEKDHILIKMASDIKGLQQTFKFMLLLVSFMTFVTLCQVFRGTV